MGVVSIFCHIHHASHYIRIVLFVCGAFTDQTVPIVFGVVILIASVEIYPIAVKVVTVIAEGIYVMDVIGLFSIIPSGRNTTIIEVGCLGVRFHHI